MIISGAIGNLSPAILSVVLIAYLMLVELGNPRMRKALMPFVIVLTIIFLIVAVSSVYLTYVKIG
jgi:hypothetical protein